MITWWRQQYSILKRTVRKNNKDILPKMCITYQVNDLAVKTLRFPQYKLKTHFWFHMFSKNPKPLLVHIFLMIKKKIIQGIIWRYLVLSCSFIFQVSPSQSIWPRSSLLKSFLKRIPEFRPQNKRLTTKKKQKTRAVTESLLFYDDLHIQGSRSSPSLLKRNLTSKEWPAHCLILLRLYWLYSSAHESPQATLFNCKKLLCT